MNEFKQYLLDKYGKPARELSLSGKNELITSDIKMIGLDQMARELISINPEFKYMPSSCDALHISDDNKEVKFYLIEFKNIDFIKPSERLKDKYKLKNSIKQVKDENIKKDLNKFANKLTDKTMLRFKLKAYDSLSLIYYYMENFFDEDSEELKKISFLLSKVFYPCFKN